MGSRGLEIVSSMDLTASGSAGARAPEEPLETTPGVFESSAEGCEATRESPLIPLTVGSHAFEAVLLRGEVDRCRGTVAIGCDGGSEGEVGVWLLIVLLLWLLVEFELALAGVTVGAAGDVE